MLFRSATIEWLLDALAARGLGWLVNLGLGGVGEVETRATRGHGGRAMAWTRASDGCLTGGVGRKREITPGFRFRWRARIS